MDENQSPGLMGWFKSHSTIIGIVAIGLVAGIAFLKKPQSSSAVPLSATGDYSGLAVDDHGRPIIYRDVSDTFINVNKTTNYNGTQPVASSPPSTPTTPGGPVEHPVEPGGSSGGHTGSSGGTYGILGANARVDFGKFQYNGGLPIPAPKGSRLVQGSENRVWVVYPGATTQDLLTSGKGPASAYLTYPIGAPFVPASSSSGGSNIQQTNVQYQTSTG